MMDQLAARHATRCGLMVPGLGNGGYRRKLFFLQASLPAVSGLPDGRAEKSALAARQQSPNARYDFRRRLTSQREVKRHDRSQKSALMKPLRYKAVEQKPLSSP